MNASAITTVPDDQQTLGALVQTQAPTPAAAQLVAAVLDKRLATARAFPRSVALAMREAEDLLREDLETARAAEYARPVGGGVVRGPSVRLAEIAAYTWGNLEIEVTAIDVSDKHLTAHVRAWDLQRNTAQTATATTTIVDRQGRRYKDSMIETAIQATVSKARRNAILSIIPRAKITHLLEYARRITAGEEKTLEQQRAELVEWFARSYRVSPEQICAAVNVSGVEDLGTSQIDDLRAIAATLRDGSATADEFFPAPATSKAEAVRQRLATRRTTTPPTTTTTEPTGESN